MGAVDVAELLPIPEIDFKSSSGYLIVPLAESAEEAVRKVLGDVIPGDWQSTRYIAVKPNGFIHLHTDPPTDETKGRNRYHVVLQTNPYCWNYHGGDIQHLSEGSVFEIDEKVEHASVNWGKTPRVHLVVDVKVKS